jgi:hypothetical protein
VEREINEPKSEMSAGAKIGAFVLTLVAIALLFLGTCGPFAVSAFAAPPPGAVPVLYVTLFAGFGIYRAIRTGNPGIRWGIIAAFVAAAVYVAANWTWFSRGYGG